MTDVIEAAAIFPKKKFETLPDNYITLARSQVLVRLGLYTSADSFELAYSEVTDQGLWWQVDVTLSPKV